MLNHYIKTAIRRLLRNKSISAINMLGLTLGMAVTFVILIFIFHETSYDRYHKNKNRIYRVVHEDRKLDMMTTHTPYPMAGVLDEEYPQIERTARVFGLFDTQVKKNQKYIEETRFYCADNELFDILTLPVLQGNPGELLNEPNDVVLTESMARKYYGNIDILGEKLVIRNAGDEITLNVSGVLRDIPDNSTFRPDFIASTDLSLRQFNKLVKSTNKTQYSVDYLKNSWETGFYLTYVLFRENINPQSFDSRFRELEKKYLEEPGQNLYHLQPLEDFYFHSGEIYSQLSAKGDQTEVYVFGVIAFLVLLIACINYILLSTSQAMNRSLEIGIRKITGAGRKYLFRQVLTESFLITLIALPLSLILIEQFRPLLNRFLEKDFIQYSILDWKMMLCFAGVIFILSYLPGLFTVRYYGKIPPIAAVKGNFLPVSLKTRVQKGLIATQFVIFLVLVTFSFGIYKQIYYSKNHDLGFDPNHVIILPLAGNPSLKSGFTGFKDALLSHNQIQYVSSAMWVPPTNSKMGIEVSKPDKPEEKVSVEGLYVDKDFVETMEIKIIKGNSFADYGENADGMVILNETAVNQLELDNPVGKKLWSGKIVGVMKDFHYHSFRRKIPPMMLVVGDHMTRHALVKTTGKDPRGVRSYIREQFRNFSGSANFSWSFLTDRFDTVYKSERRLATLVSVFSVIAIAIASMGLLGLTIFTTKRRTKEIAIRRVNGAQIRHVMGLLSGSYLRLILLATVVAIPFSYWVLQQWLQNFAYRTSLSWWIFVLSTFLALLITLITVSFQTYRAASANPAESLRYE